MVPKTTEDRVCDLLHEVLMTESKQSQMLDEVLELDLSPEGQQEIRSAWEEKGKKWKKTKLGETMDLSEFFEIACKEARNSVKPTGVIWIRDYVEHGTFPISNTSELIKSLRRESRNGLVGKVEKLIALTCGSNHQNYLLEVLQTFQRALPEYLDSLVVGVLSGVRPSYFGDYFEAKESLFGKLRVLFELSVEKANLPTEKPRNRPKASPGRPRVEKRSKKERDIMEPWETKHYQSYEKHPLAGRRYSVDEIAATIQRVRKREKRQQRTK